jgi:hypothetical protein
MQMASPDLAVGEGLVRLPLSLVGIPSARYDGEALQARDDLGVIPLRQDEEPPTPQGTYRRWVVERATKGDVIVSYAAPPRVVNASTNSGPLFDLRQESGGFIGAGVGFLAAPVPPGPWSVHLAWDFSYLPPGARGAWTHGDGVMEIVLPSQALAGLRDGDKITEVLGLNLARRDQDQTITLTVARDDGPVTLTYLPRGAPVEAFGWARDLAVPKEACRF